MLRETCRAVADGVRLTNFFAWSFTDNWEWKEGFSTRFGLVSLSSEQPALLLLSAMLAHVKQPQWAQPVEHQAA